ncbi:lamin tail domain-containing protein [Mycoplasmatota bacterium]|nr:lamin tail domain-containing protein [Mycoplasmatota bacterium]
MKFNKKLFSLLFIALFAIVLVGCNGDDETTEAPTSETPTSVDFQPAIDFLQTVYVDTIEKETFEATDDITLIDSFGDYTFTWSSSNTDYLANDGTVTRPTVTEQTQTVTLTVTIASGDETETYSFFVTIKALEEKTVEEIRDEVFLFVFAIPDNEFWTSADDLNLTTTGKDDNGNEYPITWTSSHPDIIATDGEITQPEDADVDVTLTAKFTVDGTEFSQDRTFTVAKMAVGTEVDSIADAIAEGQDAYVEITGITVIAKYDNGDVFFTDGTDILYVYSPTFDSEVGSVYDITGNIDFYYNAPQLAGTAAKPLRVEASTEAKSDIPTVDKDGIKDIIDATSVPSAEKPHEYVQFNVTASVYYEESWGNYSVFLVPTDYDFDADLADGATQPNGDAIMIYYHSDMDVLKAFHGEEITIDIIMQGYRTDKTVFYANFFGTALDVGLEFDTDQDAVDTALGIFDFPKTIIEDTTLELFDSAYGVDLSFASTDDTIFDATTGEITVDDLDAQEVITVTVTGTLNDVTTSKEFDIKVGPLPVMTISDFIDLTIGDLGKVEGTVIAGGYYGSFFIADDSGNIALNVYDDDYVDLLERNVGNIITVSGERSIYNGLIQMKVDTLAFKENPSIPTPTNVDAYTLDEDGLLTYQSQLIELTGMIIDTIETDKYGNYEITFERISDGETIFMKWDSRYDLPAALFAELEALEEGDKVDVVTILSWYNGPQLALVTTTEFTVQELTDQDKVTLDVRNMGDELELTADYAYATGDFGSKISVLEIFGTASNFIDSTSTTGTLEVSKAYGTEVSAIITFKVVSGTVEEEVEVEVTIPSSSLIAPTTELIISEYGEGSSNNKWIEIYNGTGAEVDLSDYKIVVYSNGSTEAGNTEELTGTLADGEVFVIYNADANAAVTAEGDVASTATYFNGDDAVALVKDGTIIDIILEVGHTKDDKVAGELTWVRKESVLSPNTTFTAAEWDEYAADTFDYVGSHDVETIDMDDATKVNADLAALDFGGIIKTAQTVTLPTTGANGSTIVWTKEADEDSNATFDATDSEITFTEVPADTVEEVTLQAVVTLNDEELTGTFVYKIEGVTDVDRVAADIEELKTNITGGDAYTEVSVSLPATGTNGSTIAWDIADVDSLTTLSGTDLTIARAEGTDSVVVLTATITKGGVSETLVITYNMMAEITDLSSLHSMTDDEYDIATGTEVYVVGVITQDTFDGLFIQDENGNGFFIDDKDGTVGEEVMFSGTLGVDYGVRVLLNGVQETVVSTANDLVYTTLTADEIIALDASDSGRLITYTGLKVVSISTSYPYPAIFEVEGTSKTIQLTLRFHGNYADWLNDAFVAGDLLPETSFIFYNYRDDDNQIDTFEIEFTDSLKLQADTYSFPDMLTITEDYVIPTAKYGSTYTVTGITGDAATYLDYTTTDGSILFTAPTGKVTGQITIEISLNSETVVTKTLDVEVINSVYSTGFETSEGFTSSTGYTGGLTDVNGWTVGEGTVTTTNGSTDDMHLQMRDYDSVSGFPYAEYVSTVAFNNVQFYSFTNQSSGMELVVQFSTDGTTWSTGTTITLTETDSVYEITSDVTDATYVRFTVKHTLTPDKQRVNLDDIILY